MDIQESRNLVSTFLLDETLWGISTEVVQEVVRVSEITKVNNAEEFINGIINLRGKIVTVIDLSRKLGLRKSIINEASRIIIIKWQDEQIGLLIDVISDIIEIEAKFLTSPPASMNGTRGGFIDSVYQRQDELIAILDINRVLSISDDQTVGIEQRRM